MALFLPGCGASAATIMGQARAVSDHAADVITLASRTEEATVRADALARMMACASLPPEPRYACQKSSIEAAIAAGRPAEAKLKELAGIQSDLVNVLEDAKDCETEGVSSCLKEIVSKVVASSAKVLTAVKALVSQGGGS